MYNNLTLKWKKRIIVKRKRNQETPKNKVRIPDSSLYILCIYSFYFYHHVL